MILVAPSRIEEYSARGWWGEETIGERFIRTALAQPEAFAVADAPNLTAICGRPAREWNWSELLRETGRWAAFLHAAGLRKDDIAVVQLPNCVDLHALYLACAATGIIISPLPVQYRAHEIHHALALTGARVAITTDQVGRHASASYWAEQHLRTGEITQLWSLGGSPPTGALDADRALSQTIPWNARALRRHMADIGLTAHDVLTLCWTSGTEAAAKAVPRNHNEWLVVGTSVVESAGLQPGAQLLIPFPFVNMAGMSTSLMAWLLAAGGLRHHHPFDLSLFIEQLRKHPTDYTVAAPAVIAMLLKDPGLLAGVDLSRLRTIGSGGAPVAEWLVDQLAERFGIELVNHFGSNEGAALASTPRDVPDRRQRARFFPRLGVDRHIWQTPLAARTRTRLVDLETGNEITRAGEVGELRFQGPAIFSGYFRSPELTRRAFDELGYYRTGDLFAIDGDQDQFYRFVGRHKDIIIRGGMNISAEEIEAMLLDHPKIREAAAIGVTDAILGERICAVVVPRAAADPPTLADLVAHLRDHHGAAAFKWPERLEMIDALPRNPVGKILKRTLREMFSAGGPAGSG